MTYIVNVVVQRPKTCQYFTCEECTVQLREACGWCPSSCDGRGKCRSAQFVGGPPLFGSCPVLCKQGVCVGWNQCRTPSDSSWITGAIGAPILFVSLVTLYVLMMWARRMHGTIPMYTARVWRAAGRAVSKFYLAPREHASTLQIAYLVIGVILFIILTIAGRTASAGTETYSLGEAASFLLETDACTVTFLPIASRTFRDPIEVRARVTANGTLDGVFLVTDFCNDEQFLKVNNTREAINKYDGYSCELEIEIPIDPTHTVPILHIRNIGSKATIVRKASDELVVNFGANAFSVSGTIIDLELMNFKMRRFSVPYLEGGQVMMHNATVGSSNVKTKDADVFISVSKEQSMQLPFDVTYMHPANSVCFVSKNDGLYTHTDRCVRVCSNTTVDAPNSSFVCKPQCTRTSFVRLIPFRRDLQPGLSNILISMESETGQLYFSAIAHDRLPPRSGKKLLDFVYVYDGIAGLRQPAFPPGALRLLEEGFHPAQAKRPVEDFFQLEVKGPGRPLGFFVWVPDARYVALSRWALSILSVNMLVPKDTLSNLPLRPAMCPFFDAGSEGASAYSAPPVTQLGGTKYVVAPPSPPSTDRRRRDSTATEEDQDYVYTETYSLIPSLNDRNYSSMNATSSAGVLHSDAYTDLLDDGATGRRKLLADDGLGASKPFMALTSPSSSSSSYEGSDRAAATPSLRNVGEWPSGDRGAMVGAETSVTGRRMDNFKSPIANTIYLRM